MPWNTTLFDSSGLVKDARLSQGQAAIFFLSANSMPNGANGENSYLTVWGYNLASVTDVKVNGKSQTILNTTYADPGLVMHPALVKMGKDTGVFDMTYDDNNREPYERIDVTLDNVTSGDTGIQFVGAGLVTTETGTVELTDTISSFAIHTGNCYFVDLDAGVNGTGTEASPWNTLTDPVSSTSAGDAVYYRETASEYVSASYFINFTNVSHGGSASQPKLYCNYPGEFPTINCNADTPLRVAAQGTFSYVSIGGFAFDGKITTTGSRSIVTGFAGQYIRKNIRFFGNNCSNLYSGSSGCFMEVSGSGSSYADCMTNIRLVGNYCDNTSEPNLSQTMAHVYYFGGRNFADGIYFLHNRSTRHGAGRVQQIYGHTSNETARNIFSCFQNLEGRKQDAGAAPDVFRAAGSDSGDPIWFEDLTINYDTYSGGSNGFRIIHGDAANSIITLSVSNVCGYDNSTNDILLETYDTATVSNCCLEKSVNDSQGEATITNVSTNYPACLA